LSLKIRGKRPDGFHELETLIVPVSLADTLRIELAEEFSFSCDEPEVPSDDRNLVVRAAKLFFNKIARESRVRIELAKKIPHGAGLGGGSSDAASTLLGLNAMLNNCLSLQQLAELASELGSDVPVFLFQSAAICRGRGEIVEPIAFPHSLPLLLLKPPFGVPTPWAYKNWSSSRELAGVPYSPQPVAAGTLVNDLERPVFEKYIFLAMLKRWLLSQPESDGALMSGSGSTMFCMLRDESHAMPLAERARAEFGSSLWTCACQTAPVYTTAPFATFDEL